MKKLTTIWPFLIYTVILNGWFVLYFTWLQPPFFARLQRISERPDALLGLMLALLLCSELLGVWLKYPGLLQQAPQAQKDKRGQTQQPAVAPSLTVSLLVGIAILAHVGLVMFLFTWRVMLAFGVDLGKDPPFWQGLLAFAFFMAMIAKEGALLAPLMELLNRPPNFSAVHIPIVFQQLYRRTWGWSAMLGDFILAVFGAVAYTVVWETLAADMPFMAATLGRKMLEYLGALALFCMIVPATQIVSLLETWLLPSSAATRRIAVVSFVVSLVIAISGIRRLY